VQSDDDSRLPQACSKMSRIPAKTRKITSPCCHYNRSCERSALALVSASGLVEPDTYSVKPSTIAGAHGEGL
jgi:hypothetical protein